jgi:polyhydroxyalkanoate synthesis repressor PhaR
MAILIKRYANRKLYNTDTSRYITLKGIAKLLDEGDEVRVVDNETGEDITQIALSQILVDNKRSKEDPSDTLLSQILSRGGDALYGAIRKSVDDATEGIGDFQDRFRQLVGQVDPTGRHGRGGLGFGWERRSEADRHNASSSRTGGDDERSPGSVSQSGSHTSELDEIVRKAVEQALEAHDVPRRREIEALGRNLDRVAAAIARLEAATLIRDQPPAGDRTNGDRERA